MVNYCEFCASELGPGWDTTCDRCTRWGQYVDRLACIGRPPEHRDHPKGKPGIMPIVDPEARIEAFATVDAGWKEPTRIGKSWLMKGVHVGHDAQIGDGCELAPHCAVGGHVVLEGDTKIGMGATIRPGMRIGHGARIGMGAVVVADVPPGELWVGNPAHAMEWRKWAAAVRS